MSNSISEKKLRIFVSSVGVMMDEERRTLRDLIWKSGHIPIAMEGFSGNHEQTSIEVVKDNLDHADVVIFVLGFTYGSLIGEGLKCQECPVKGSCNAKSRKVGNCVISYTNFEYLYAKHKNILSYCIIQKDICDANAFNKRLDTFITQNNSMGAHVKNDLSSEYFTKKEIYEKLISKAKKKWAFFYDANSSVEISASITRVFSDIQTQLVKDGENISGLIDGNQVKNDLIEKNRQIAELEKDINQLSRDTLTAVMQAYQRTSLSSTAVTGTCIPFMFSQEEDMIITYLVCNSAYSKGNRFMFPGGHAFVNEESPEAVAIMKAKTEAGLDVKPIDLYLNFNNRPDRFSAQFTIYRPPHFTYLFEQDDSAKCYREKNHTRHYDAVYVCEIFDIHPDIECSQARIVVKLPNKSLSLVQIKKIIEGSIEQYNLQNQLEATEGESVGNYIAKMLMDAHIDYIKYLNR